MADIFLTAGHVGFQIDSGPGKITMQKGGIMYQGNCFLLNKENIHSLDAFVMMAQECIMRRSYYMYLLFVRRNKCAYFESRSFVFSEPAAVSNLPCRKLD